MDAVYHDGVAKEVLLVSGEGDSEGEPVTLADAEGEAAAEGEAPLL